MLKSKQLVILASVTFLLVVLAIVFVNQDKKRSQQTVAGKLFPELQKEINNVARIEISDSKGRVTLVLENDGDWQVVEQHHYHADTGKIKKLLLELSALERLDAKTKIADNYSKLGVDAPDTSSIAKQVIVSDDAGKTLSGIIMGKNRTGGSPAMYVRKVDDDQSWLVSGHVNVNIDSKNWIDRQPVKMESQQVAKIAITSAEGESFVLSRAKQEDTLQLEKLPERRELKDVSGLQSALQSISFDEVLREEELDLKEAVPSRAEYTGFDGLKIIVTAYKAEDKHYIKISAEGDNQAQADQINKRVNGWLYQIPAYQYNKFNQTLMEITQEKSEE